MAKFLKSIFHTTDRRKSSHYENEGDEEKSESSGSRRQLSISRSGRMKQANKKRHSLTLELYGDTIQIDAVDKPTSMEYYVHNPSHTAPVEMDQNTNRFEDTADIQTIHHVEPSTEVATFDANLDMKLRTLAIEKSPEEEIDHAFEIIDKS